MQQAKRRHQLFIGNLNRFSVRPVALLPIYPGPINRHYGIGDMVRPSIIFDSFDAPFQAHVIHNDKTARRQFRVQMRECVHCGLIQIAIQAQKRQPISGKLRQTVFEPAFDKNDLLVQKVHPLEILSNTFKRVICAISPAYPSLRGPDQRDICPG